MHTITEGGIKVSILLKDLPAEILLKWLRGQKKDQFTINDILGADIAAISVEQRRKAVWRLLDRNEANLTGDMKIIVK